MNIVCATDNNFVQHCGVMLVSLLKNNSKDVVIYLLTEGLTQNNVNLLNEIVTLNGGTLHVVIVNSSVLKDCPMPSSSNLSHISIATYYRLLIPKLLPNVVEKVIYLDCDIVIRHSIQELWETALDDNAIGAVAQIVEWNILAIKRLNYPLKFGYFNAGVLLINLNYWRKNNITEKLFEYLIKKHDVIKYHDQDALNGVLYDKSTKISIKWNMLTGFFMKKTLKVNDYDNGIIINNYSDYKDQLLKEKDDPTIVHFVSTPKPWDVGCTHPFKNDYYYYLQFTPWKDFKLPYLISYIFKRPTIVYRILKNRLKQLLLGNPYFKINK